MNKQANIILSDIFILTAAVVWGLAFVAQRISIDYIGAFYFNGIRFFLGALSLIPLLLFYKSKNSVYLPLRKTLVSSMIAGLFLYIAVSMQQVSLYFTTAGNAGFITGLYVVVVPMLLLLKEQKIASHTIAAAGLSACGLYFLSVTEGFHINRGDLIVIVSTLFWAFHVLYIGRLSGRHNPIAISFFQFMTCSILSLISGALFEEISVAIVRSTMLPILYGGLISVGIGYTLQVVGQKYAPPHHAAVLMSMEAVFAVIGAFFIIGEEISGRAFFGCTLMFAGMVIAQTGNWFGKRTKE